MDHERIMLIFEFLSKNTDTAKGVTIADIQGFLAEKTNLRNVSVLTIRRDIDRLTSMGYDISKTNGAHNTAYYHMKGKGFTFNEIRFLVDSVSINKFLSNEQKQRLIGKFEGMCSESEIRQLISRISLNGRAAPSLDLLNNLEIIHRRISEKRRIHFEYGHFDTKRNMNYYKKSREMIPIKVVYFSERFYLRCVNEQTGEPRTYRIDRMKNITGGTVTRKKFTLPKYEGFVADMFPPDYFETVTLKVKKFLRDEMIEQLGELASIRDDFDDEEMCVVRFKAGINKQFFLWLLHYGDNVQLTAPKKEREMFADELRKILGNYADI